METIENFGKEFTNYIIWGEKMVHKLSNESCEQ
jgi:hypothetical protein